MNYMVEANLLRFKEKLEYSLRINAERGLHKTAASKAVVFLSHQKAEQHMVEQARLFIASQGMDLYVDYKDGTIPPVTDPASARALKQRIDAARMYILLASDKDLDNRWLGWELGLAHAAKTIDRVAVLPVASYPGTWRAKGYFDLYPKVLQADDGDWHIVPADAAPVTLRDWLRW
jgi:hypothetical protein